MGPDVRLRVMEPSPVRLSAIDSAPVGLRVTDGLMVTANTDYEVLDNKPSIEEVTLVGNKELSDFGMGLASRYDISLLFV